MTGHADLSSDADSRRGGGQITRDRNQVAVLLKAVRVLEAFTPETPIMSLSALALSANISRTTAHRILSSLQSAGWVRRCGEGRYTLTLRLFELGAGVVKTLSLRDEAITAMFELQELFKETVYLFAPEGDRAVCLERVEGLRPVRLMGLDVGGNMPLLAGAAPFTMLAHLGAGEIDRIARKQSGPLRPGIPTLTALHNELEAIRERGYAVCFDGAGPGTASIGAPVFGNSGNVVGAIGLGGLREHFTDARICEMAEGLIARTRRISHRLGAEPRRIAR
jgi:DNA-binding IclR family transcriptional regulator